MKTNQFSALQILFRQVCFTVYGLLKKSSSSEATRRNNSYFSSHASKVTVSCGLNSLSSLPIIKYEYNKPTK